LEEQLINAEKEIVSKKVKTDKRGFMCCGVFSGPKDQGVPDAEDDLPGIEIYYLQMMDRMKTIFVDYSY